MFAARTRRVHARRMIDRRERERRFNRPTGTVAPPPRVEMAVRDLIERYGEPWAVERLGVGRSTVARLAGRLPCRRGSILMAARALGMDLEGAGL